MIEVNDLTLQAGDFRLDKIGFQVPQGAYAILMGKTGSGKTTLLEAICGLRSIEGGSIHTRAGDITHARPAERGIGYVPQDGALFPTLTVREHLGFALKYHRWNRVDAEARVKELAELLGITHLLERKPKGLSGGERQRVALGRALAFQPNILCLDEPVSSLDDETKAGMYELLREVKKQEDVTALHVTHSREEARRLGSMLIRIGDGRAEQVKDFVSENGM
jgi:ABC-type sugar transport system ATPase subunit